jgi:hypothetical protein
MMTEGTAPTGKVLQEEKVEEQEEGAQTGSTQSQAGRCTLGG